MSDNLEQNNDIELYYLLKSEKETAEKAFALLYAKHSPRIYAYCRRFLGNKEDAQDIFQETFVRFYQSVKEDRVMTNVPAFLLKIARNLCVNNRKKQKEQVTFEEYMSLNRDSEDKEEMLELIHKALDTLPDDYKEMFILREYEGLSYLDIAEVTNTSLANVKIRLFRAKKKIREYLQPYLVDLSKF